jgi:hypothetical protein
MNFKTMKFPALPASSPAARVNTSARTSIRGKMIETALILAAANVAKQFLPSANKAARLRVQVNY